MGYLPPLSSISSQLCAESLKGVRRHSGLLLRAARFRLVGQEPVEYFQGGVEGDLELDLIS